MSKSGKHSQAGENAEVASWIASVILDSAPTGQIPVQRWRLRRVSQRPAIKEYLSLIWDRRHFIIADSKARAFQTTRGMFLGKVWLVVSPFLESLMYWVIFGLILQTHRGIPNFLGYLVVGVNFFPVVMFGLIRGSSAVQSSRNLIRAFVFPRATVVLSWLFRTIIDFIPIAVATLFFLMMVPPHVTPGITWIYAIPVLFVGFLFSLGLALFTSSITARIPDLKFIWPLIGRLWFYMSGIFFSIDRFEARPRLMALMEANPGYVFLAMCRDALVYSRTPQLEDFMYLLSWAVLLVVIGFVVFWTYEEEYGQDRS